MAAGAAEVVGVTTTVAGAAVEAVVEAEEVGGAIRARTEKHIDGRSSLKP